MSGGGGYPENTTTTSTSEPWSGAQPYLTQGLQGVNSVFGTPGTDEFASNAMDRITGFSDPTLAAMGMTSDIVFDNSNAIGQARDASLYGLGVGAAGLGSAPNMGALGQSYIGADGQIDSSITGQDAAALGLYGDQALATDALMQAAMDPVQSRINEQAAAAGRVGSGLHDYAMSSGLMAAAAPIAFEAQNAAMQRGSDLYSDAANRQAGLANSALGYADSQFGQSSDLISSMAGLQPGLTQGDLTGTAALAQVGGEIEALQDAYANAEYDQLTDYLQRVGYLSGFGGSTTSNVGVTDSGGGGFGLAQGLGGLIAGTALASSIFG